jgi:hypothetical protein
MTKPLPKIKRCRKCGRVEKGPYVTSPYGYEVKPTGFFVSCYNCWAEGPKRKTIRGAINAWNRRVSGKQVGENK